MLKLTALFLSTILALSPAHAASDQKETPSLKTIVFSLDKAMRDNHYDPAELKSDAYKQMQAEINVLADTAESQGGFIEGFNKIWHDGPFSHVRLTPADRTATEQALFFDGLRIGGGGAQLSWQGETAVLTVNTMIGLDTIEEIDAAYEEIARKGAESLIIDLRANHGGTFAIRPLVAHLIDKPHNAGSFVGQLWNKDHAQPPTGAELADIAPWDGWSILGFWADISSDPVIRVQFMPVENPYKGPVYVLTSHQTASAAELATDALKSSGRATIIGETTAAEMLSQKPFDIPGGLLLYLPVADYYSTTNGRIEGTGVTPHIEVKAADAMARAFSEIALNLATGSSNSN